MMTKSHFSRKLFCLTGGGAHVHVRVIMRGRYGRWGHGHRKSLTLGMRGQRPGQGLCGGVAGRLRVHLVAPWRGRRRGWADPAARLEAAFWLLWQCLVELDGDVAGGLRGAAASLWWGPGRLRVEVLATVVATLRQAWTVDCRVGAVHLFFCVALHE